MPWPRSKPPRVSVSRCRLYPAVDAQLRPWVRDEYQYILWLLALAVLFGYSQRVEQLPHRINQDDERGHDALLHRLFERVGQTRTSRRFTHSPMPACWKALTFGVPSNSSGCCSTSNSGMTGHGVATGMSAIAAHEVTTSVTGPLRPPWSPCCGRSMTRPSRHPSLSQNANRQGSRPCIGVF